MNKGWTYQDKVDRTSQGSTVLDYYTTRYHHSNKAEWKKRIDRGQILLDGYPTTNNTCLQLGQILTYHRPPWQEPEVPLDFSIIYEDRELLVVAKPSGIPVLPGGRFLENTLLWQLQQNYPHSPPIPIHRLGRGTSGIIVLSSSKTARANLSQQMRSGKMQKTYLTLACGNSMVDTFTVNQPIGKIPYPVLGYLYAATDKGLFAQSKCQVLKRYQQTSLLKVTILTGRPHQIRIHLAAKGYPLWGDPLYGVGGVPKVSTSSESGKLTVPGDCGYHLHAWQIAFNHPKTGKLVNFTCTPPSKLQP